MLIAASGIGALCGILGQAIREWLSRPRINIEAVPGKGQMTFLLYFINLGRKSTEDLAIDIVHFEESILDGSQRTVFHTTDMTIHPRTGHSVPFGRIDGNSLKIRRSDFGKAFKFTDDGDEWLKEWVFPLPVEFYVSACAKDARARMMIIRADEKGVHLKKPGGISYNQLKRPNDLRGEEEVKEAPPRK